MNHKDKLMEIDEKGMGLTDWEIEFVGSLIDKDWEHYTKKQRTKCHCM